MHPESADQRIVRVISSTCLLTLACLLAALAQSPGEVEAEVDAPVQIVRVDWSRYHEDLRLRVNAVVAHGDCAGMVEEYRRAAADDVRRRLRGAEGSGPLISFLRRGLGAAGCPQP